MSGQIVVPPLRYTWRALQRLEADFGSGFMDVIESVLTKVDPANLSIVIAAAFDPPDPRSDPAYWMDNSPAIAQAQERVGRAIAQAITGDPPENPMTPSLALTRLWRRLVRHGSDTADHPQTSIP